VASKGEGFMVFIHSVTADIYLMLSSSFNPDDYVLNHSGECSPDAILNPYIEHLEFLGWL